MKYLKTVGLWIWQRFALCLVIGWYLWVYYEMLVITGEYREAHVVDFWDMLIGLGGLAGMLYVSYSAGRESKQDWISPERYSQRLDDHIDFVLVAGEMAAIQDKRLADAKVMLHARCSEMPACSRKTALLAEVDAL
jgi:hypothetical protein